MRAEENPYDASRPTEVDNGCKSERSYSAATDPVTLLVRYLIVAVSCLSILFWAFYALAKYPWIVPADSLLDTSAFERASLAALWLAALSFAPPLLVIGGLIGVQRCMRIAAAVVILGWLAAAPWLFVDYGRMDYLIRLRLPFYIVGLLLLVGSVCSRGRDFARPG